MGSEAARGSDSRIGGGAKASRAGLLSEYEEV
jgi:hypothetical protein